jgi:hypothetical protein
VAPFAVKKFILFLYSAIHKVSTLCAQLIHSPARANARDAEICAIASGALLPEAGFTPMVLYHLGRGGKSKEWPFYSPLQDRKALISSS